MSLKHLPQSERLLSGILSVLLNAVDTTATVSTPPDATRLPTYIEFEPGGGNAELVRVTGVSGSIITIERGVNNGGIGLPHAQNSAYKEKFTSSHWQEVVDALESGFLSEDASYSFAKVDADTFTITGADETAYFTTGRIVRLSGSVICAVVSSSYGANVTTVNVTGGTVPTTVSSVELAIQPINAADQFVTMTGAQTLTNKTLTSPVINTSISGTAILDEDDMSSDSNTKIPTQQSVKAYADGKISKPGSEAQGDILYHNGTTWARLGAGTSGYFLKTNGAGANPSWAASSGGVKCRVRLASDVTLTASTPTKITFSTEDYDTGSNFASNKFTVTTAGYYRLFTQVHFYNGSTTTNNFTVFLYKNGSSISSANVAGNGVTGNSCAVSDVVHLDVNDYIECYATAPAANWLAYAESTLTHMNIEQISAD